ncbi:hypothetical protein ACIBHX_19765 [Nonomuraea sp. NPDC050536]|uniref:hypothetical protein n=1 Tax=Nonomuraea sp. NPDC050536 TaxID=3364366 RepID=UPI0037CB6DBE
MMYGSPPPEYPRATSSPTLILLASGLAGVIGLLFGLFIGMGLDQGPSTPARAPTVTVTVESSAPPQGSAPATTPPLAQTSPPGLITAPTQTSPPAQTVPTGTGTPPATGFSLSAGRTLVVGRDIQPGTYRTTGPAPGQPACFWARLRSTSPNPADIIAADMPKSAATVTILPTDKGFQTMGCADWTRS